jgi:enoyl-CoA hydratase/carnithine racemase
MTSTNEQLIDYAQNGPVIEIVLNRADKRNALNIPMVRELSAAIEAAGRADDARVVILRGAGKAFSAGIDVTTFMALGQEYGPRWLQRMRTISDDLQSVFTRLERLELPVIALLHGYCLGMGLELALACDMRLAAAGTQIGLPETRLGLIPDVGGTTRLLRLVGVGRAKELIMTGKTIDAEQAAAWGVVNGVVPPEDLAAAGQALVDDLLPAAPLAVGMAKRVIDGIADVDRGLQLEAWAQSQLVASEDFQAAVQAFITRRPAQFKGK